LIYRSEGKRNIILCIGYDRVVVHHFLLVICRREGTAHPGPMLLRGVEDAHAGIITVMRSLKDSGEMVRGMPGMGIVERIDGTRQNRIVC